MTRGVQGLLAVLVCLLVGAAAVGFAVGQSTGDASQSAATPDFLATFSAVIDATAGARSAATPSPLSQNAAAGQPAMQQVAVINQPAVQQRTGLPIQDVMGWCRGTGCTVDHFRQLPESNGVLNPNGVLFMITVAGDASDFTMPAGVTVDVYDCTTTRSQVRGPQTLTHVCQASFRKG